MRFISPSFLAFTLLMSLLPWVEVRCDQVGAPASLTGYAVVTQNGWQTVWGETTGNAPNVPNPMMTSLLAPVAEGSLSLASVIKNTGSTSRNVPLTSQKKAWARLRMFGAVQKQASLAFASSLALKCSR